VSDDPRQTARHRFLSRNPKSELYADFPDFSFWRVEVEAGHLNGGFGRAASFAALDILTPIDGCEALLEGEDGAVAHMNADHRDAIQLYATRLAGLPEGDWRLSGLDPEGIDLVSGDRTGRLVFPIPVRSGSELRKRLVDLAADARAMAG
jgi:putative heme iron utilization protein